MKKSEKYVGIDAGLARQIITGKTAKSFETISEMLGYSKGWLSNVLTLTKRMSVNDIDKMNRFLEIDLSKAVIDGDKENKVVEQTAESSITKEDIDRLIEALDKHSSAICDALDRHSDVLSDDVSRMVNTWMRLTEKLGDWLK